MTHANRLMDISTAGRTIGHTDGQKEEWTKPPIELRVRSQKEKNGKQTEIQTDKEKQKKAYRHGEGQLVLQHGVDQGTGKMTKRQKDWTKS